MFIGIRGDNVTHACAAGYMFTLGEVTRTYTCILLSDNITANWMYLGADAINHTAIDDCIPIPVCTVPAVITFSNVDATFTNITTASIGKQAFQI
jgi:hypothetical protein